ncbi:uncharacterized protein [Nicotiana tomentosiformis]|uniref:uncharacterized protein n=1 Tax=Nicotiana tomentosiformis TaxID=4098 RepID=UPI00388C4AA7
MTAPGFQEVMGCMMWFIDSMMLTGLFPQDPTTSQYKPPSEREELRGQFERLRQGHIFVIDYEARFTDLSRHAAITLPTDAERVLRFIAGLHPEIHVFMAREAEMGTPFHQGSTSGYSGHQGQTSSQQSTDPRDCFECGELGHVKRFCPKLRGKAEKQDHQPTLIAPATTLPARSVRGGGQVGRGRPRGGGHSGGTLSRFYAFLARTEAVASDAVITCTISVFNRDASVLFDPGPTYSYVSSLFAPYLDVSRKSLGIPVYVSMTMGDSIDVDRVYRSCMVTFCGFETRAGLLLLDMVEFEVILGMDWLSPYHAILHCYAKTVTLAMPEFPKLE